MRKPDFCLGENKGADQLRGNREADQRLCFRYTDSTISLLLKSETCFCDCTGWFVSDLVVNPEDRFSRVAAQISLLPGRFRNVLKSHTKDCRGQESNPSYVIIEPRREKTGLRGFRQGLTQTGLCSNRRWLEA